MERMAAGIVIADVHSALEATVNVIKASYITNINKWRGIPRVHGNIYIESTVRDIELQS
jgi:hypothetical protein